MPARAIWKGVLKIGRESVPVKLYSAVQDRAVHFHILDARTEQPVKQRMVEPESGEEVPHEDIQRGLEVEPGTFVLIQQAELDAVAPKPSTDIEVTRFVPPERINHQWYDRPYYLGPDGESEGDYFALAKALEGAELEGVARWVMRNKEYLGALRVRGKYLMLVTLRHAGEVLSPKELPKLTGRAPDPREIEMARQLVTVLEDEFRPEDFRDEYRDRVLDFIQAKAKGRKPKLQKIEQRPAAGSLLDALSASLKKTKAGGKAVA